MSYHSILIGDNCVLYIQLLRGLYSHCDCITSVNHMFLTTASICFPLRPLQLYALLKSFNKNV